MSGKRRWVVLAPGEVAWVERRTREILEQEEDGSEHHFRVIPGQGRYQAIVEKGHQDFSSEMLLGEALSRECEEPVYAIQRVDEFFHVSRFLKGEASWEEREPEELIHALGCVSEWTVEPPLELPKKMARTVALIQGLNFKKIYKALEKEAGHPLPVGYYRIEETPLGVLLTDGTGPLIFAHNYLAERFPRATVYSVTASPDLGFFVIFLMQGNKTLKFVPSPQQATNPRTVHEIMGERDPERILAALGIPKEWFQL